MAPVIGRGPDNFNQAAARIARKRQKFASPEEERDLLGTLLKTTVRLQSLGGEKVFVLKCGGHRVLKSATSDSPPPPPIPSSPAGHKCLVCGKGLHPEYVARSLEKGHPPKKCWGCHQRLRELWNLGYHSAVLNIMVQANASSGSALSADCAAFCPEGNHNGAGGQVTIHALGGLGTLSPPVETTFGDSAGTANSSGAGDDSDDTAEEPKLQQQQYQNSHSISPSPPSDRDVSDAQGGVGVSPLAPPVSESGSGSGGGVEVHTTPLELQVRGAADANPSAILADSSNPSDEGRGGSYRR